ncbi:MAG: lysophospholipid acyltransferase family protein [Candidatus Kerfeldbacteria bacterium]
MVYVTVRNILYPLFKGIFSDISGGEHLPKHGPYLIAANHIDYLDGFYIAMALHEINGHEVYFLTKSNNYWWTRAALRINPDRKSESVDDALRYIRQGKIICNFIEGSRNAMLHLLKGRTGTARLALLAGIPVIPVGLFGLTGRNFVQSLTNLVAMRKNLSIRFGPAIDLERFRGKQLDYGVLQEATQEIMRGVVPLAEKVYVG